MQTILLVIHLILAIALIGAVLMQRSEGGALGMGGGGGGGGGGAGGGLFSARGTANALTRTTAILAACFMSTSLLLAVIASQTSESGSILDNPAAITPLETTPEAPSEPSVPLSN